MYADFYVVDKQIWRQAIFVIDVTKKNDFVGMLCAHLSILIDFVLLDKPISID